MANHTSFQKGQKRLPNAGRKKGSVNKFTTVKEAFMDALEELGGVRFLVNLCKTQQGRIAFMTAIARMLPKPVEVSGPDGGPVKIGHADYLSDSELLKIARGEAAQNQVPLIDADNLDDHQN